MKKSKWVLVLLTVIVFLVGCSNSDEVQNPYEEEWIIGKTREEIEEKYGVLDKYVEEGDTARGKYIIQEDEPEVIGNGVLWGWHLEITFDSNGKAISAEVVSNGIGG